MMSGPSKVKLMTHKFNYEAMRMRFLYKWNPFSCKFRYNIYTFVCHCLSILQILDQGQTIHYCQDLTIFNCTVIH